MLNKIEYFDAFIFSFTYPNISFNVTIANGINDFSKGVIECKPSTFGPYPNRYLGRMSTYLYFLFRTVIYLIFNYEIQLHTHFTLTMVRLIMNGSLGEMINAFQDHNIKINIRALERKKIKFKIIWIE